MQKALRSNSLVFSLIFLTGAAGWRAQSDTIYQRDGTIITATVTEVGEQGVSYQLSAGNTASLPGEKIRKIVLRNGSTESFTNTPARAKDTAATARKPAATDKNDKAFHDRIEKLGIEVGRKYMDCAINYPSYCAPGIDWSATQRDYFKPEYITIVIKGFYKRDNSMGEKGWVVFHINLEEKTGNYTCTFKNCSNYSDQPDFMKCQRRMSKKSP